MNNGKAKISALSCECEENFEIAHTVDWGCFWSRERERMLVIKTG